MRAFTGSVSRIYKINRLDISHLTPLNTKNLSFNEDDEYEYEKGGARPHVHLWDVSDTGYTVSYSNNNIVSENSARKPVVKLTGKGNYTGTVSANFTIVKKNIEDLNMSVNDLVASRSPNKHKQTPVITDLNGKKLVAGTDYEKVFKYTYMDGSEVSPRDVIPAGTKIKITVTGKGNYYGTISREYTIAAAKINTLKFTVNGGKPYTYTGKEIRPGKSAITLSVKAGRSWKPLSESEAEKAYEIISYKNNISRGTATITIKGTGDYAGTMNITFKIVNRTIQN